MNTELREKIIKLLGFTFETHQKVHPSDKTETTTSFIIDKDNPLNEREGFRFWEHEVAFVSMDSKVDILNCPDEEFDGITNKLMRLHSRYMRNLGIDDCRKRYEKKIKVIRDLLGIEDKDE